MTTHLRRMTTLDDQFCPTFLTDGPGRASRRGTMQDVVRRVSLITGDHDVAFPSIAGVPLPALRVHGTSNPAPRIAVPGATHAIGREGTPRGMPRVSPPTGVLSLGASLRGASGPATPKPRAGQSTTALLLELSTDDDTADDDEDDAATPDPAAFAALPGAHPCLSAPVCPVGAAPRLEFVGTVMPAETELDAVVDEVLCRQRPSDIDVIDETAAGDFLRSAEVREACGAAFWIAVLRLKRSAATVPSPQTRAEMAGLEPQLLHHLGSNFGAAAIKLYTDGAAKAAAAGVLPPRDAALRLFPLVAAQVVFFALTHVFPHDHAKGAFAPAFRQDLLKTLHFWATGVLPQTVRGVEGWASSTRFQTLQRRRASYVAMEDKKAKLRSSGVYHEVLRRTMDDREVEAQAAAQARAAPAAHQGKDGGKRRQTIMVRPEPELTPEPGQHRPSAAGASSRRRTTVSLSSVNSRRRGHRGSSVLSAANDAVKRRKGRKMLAKVLSLKPHVPLPSAAPNWYEAGMKHVQHLAAEPLFRQTEPRSAQSGRYDFPLLPDITANTMLGGASAVKAKTSDSEATGATLATTDPGAESDTGSSSGTKRKAASQALPVLFAPPPEPPRKTESDGRVPAAKYTDDDEAAARAQRQQQLHVRFDGERQRVRGALPTHSPLMAYYLRRVVHLDRPHRGAEITGRYTTLTADDVKPCGRRFVAYTERVHAIAAAVQQRDREVLDEDVRQRGREAQELRELRESWDAKIRAQRSAGQGSRVGGTKTKEDRITEEVEHVLKNALHERGKLPAEAVAAFEDALKVHRLTQFKTKPSQREHLAGLATQVRKRLVRFKKFAPAEWSASKATAEVEELARSLEATKRQEDQTPPAATAVVAPTPAEVPDTTTLHRPLLTVDPPAPLSPTAHRLGDHDVKGFLDDAEAQSPPNTASGTSPLNPGEKYNRLMRWMEEKGGVSPNAAKALATPRHGEPDRGGSFKAPDVTKRDFHFRLSAQSEALCKPVDPAPSGAASLMVPSPDMGGTPVSPGTVFKALRMTPKEGKAIALTSPLSDASMRSAFDDRRSSAVVPGLRLKAPSIPRASVALPAVASASARRASSHQRSDPKAEVVADARRTVAAHSPGDTARRASALVPHVNLSAFVATPKAKTARNPGPKAGAKALAEATPPHPVVLLEHRRGQAQAFDSPQPHPAQNPSRSPSQRRPSVALRDSPPRGTGANPSVDRTPSPVRSVRVALVDEPRPMMTSVEKRRSDAHRLDRLAFDAPPALPHRRAVDPVADSVVRKVRTHARRAVPPALSSVSYSSLSPNKLTEQPHTARPGVGHGHLLAPSPPEAEEVSPASAASFGSPPLMATTPMAPPPHDTALEATVPESLVPSPPLSRSGPRRPGSRPDSRRPRSQGAAPSE